MNLASLAQAAKAQPELKKLEKATKQMEGIFLKQLLEQLQKGTNAFGKGSDASVYQDLFNQAMVDRVGQSGSLGISKMLFRQMAPRVIATISTDPSETQTHENS